MVHGLTAQFFNDPNNGATHLGTVALTRVDTTVNYAWGTAAPATGITANYFSARWSGKVQPNVTGSYRFRTISDDGVRLWVNGVQVINNWTDHSSTTNTSNTITLTAGREIQHRPRILREGRRRDDSAAVAARRARRHT